MSHSESTWERIQEKAFTQWLDDTIKKGDPSLSVHDLRTDLQDGTLLIRFFELLSGKSVREKYEKHPRSKIHEVQNLHIALTFLKDEMGFANPGCSVENIWDAPTAGIKMILGLLWTLYRRYRMAVDGVDGKRKGKEEDALLDWVKVITSGYDGVNVTNFRSSFNDGLAFLALVHAYDPDSCPFNYEELRSSGKDHSELLSTAFEAAEKHLGVNKLLEADEVAAGGMDERAMALYTSLYYHAFKARADMQEMQMQLGASSQTLELEKKGKGELIKMNCELSDALALKATELEEQKKLLEARDAEIRELTLKVSALESSVSERDARIRDLLATVSAKDDELAAQARAYSAKQDELTEMENVRNDCLIRIKQLEEAMRNLQMQLDAANSCTEEERQEHQKKEVELTALGQKLKEAEDQLKMLAEMREGGEKELLKKLEQQSHRAAELEARNNELEEKVKGESVKVKELGRRIKKQEKAEAENEKKFEVSEQHSKVAHRGLAVLRTNLERHITDIHRWQGFLEGGAKDVTDPVAVIQTIGEELERLSFKEQLEHVSGLLEKENTEMTKLLVERRAALGMPVEKEKKEKLSKEAKPKDKTDGEKADGTNREKKGDKEDEKKDRAKPKETHEPHASERKEEKKDEDKRDKEEKADKKKKEKAKDPEDIDKEEKEKPEEKEGEDKKEKTKDKHKEHKPKEEHGPKEKKEKK